MNPSPRTATSRRRLVIRFVVPIAMIIGALVVGLAGTGSTYALWNGSKPIGAVSLTTGSVGLTVNGATSYTVPGLTTTQLLPGLSAVSPTLLAIQNTGTTPLSVSVGAPTFSNPSSLLAQNGNLVVSLFQSSTCSQAIDGSSVAAWTTPVVLAAGASITACLQMTLSPSAPASVQGLSATFTLPLSGVQTRNNP